MIGNLLSWLAIVAVAVFFGWLAFRLWRSKSGFVKWAGALVSGLLALLLGLVGVVLLMGLFKAYFPRQVEVPELSVPLTPEYTQRGEHLASTFCISCHSTTGELPLTGGFDMAEDISIPLGSFVSVNLTPAGPLNNWTDGEIFVALRHGLNPSKQPLVMMSNVRARNLSDEDTYALIAYLRSQPAVENETPDPADKINLLGIILGGVGLVPAGKPPVEGVITAPPKAATLEYGEYILSYQDCRDCHGEDLKGGKEGQLGPIGWNLDIMKNWTLEQFVATMRTGVDPNGYHLSENMPWQAIGRMDDVELEAMYLYLTSLP